MKTASQAFVFETSTAKSSGPSAALEALGRIPARGETLPASHECYGDVSSSSESP